MIRSLFEGVLYSLMVGCGEMYFLANAVRHGASALEQALIVTLPLCIGALGPIGSLVAMSHRVRRKRVVITATATQALVLVGLTAAEIFALSTVPLLIALSCCYQICGQAAGTAWSSWYGDLVPSRIRGRYFARRNRAAHAGTCISVIAAGLLLQYTEPGAPGVVSAGAGGIGYTVIFGLAALFRAASVILLALSPEPAYAGVADIRTAGRALLSKQSSAPGRIVLVAFAMQLMVFVGSPYFAPFMLDVLHLSYIEYTAANVAMVAMKVLTLPAWGLAVDRFGPHAVFALAAVLVSLIPVPWLASASLTGAILGQMVSGFSWAGYEVSQFSLVLTSTESRTRPHVLAVQFMLNGSAQLTGSLLGGMLLSASDRSFFTVFVATMLGRLVVALFVPGVIPQTDRQERVQRRTVLLRVVGFRPNGGVGLRPIVLDASSEPTGKVTAGSDPSASKRPSTVP